MFDKFRKPRPQVEVIPTRDGGATVSIGRGRGLSDRVVTLRPNEVHAAIIRKDGTVEDLGITSNLRTTAGLDWQADVMGNASQPVSARWIGLTTNATAPAAGDTALTGEITTGGLGRAAGTYAHTAAATSYTISNTFTATATHTAVAKAGLFTATTAGTLAFETLLSTTATLASGDTLAVTWTVNI